MSASRLASIASEASAASCLVAWLGNGMATAGDKDAAAAIAAATATIHGLPSIRQESMPEGTPVVRGYDFNKGIDYNALLNSYLTTGFQATSLGQAVDLMNEVLAWRLSHDIANGTAYMEADDDVPAEKTKAKIFLGFTSNLVTSGLRETIRFLVQHKMVDCIVTTGGGIEEDLIKCLEPTFVGDFHMPGSDLRMRGLNRAGNLVIPNKNYCAFEDWLMPVLDKCYADQEGKNKTLWTPSTLIAELGKAINNEDSICYWAWKNDIPIFSPALTDGSLGDMLYFHSYKAGPLVVDIVGDIRRIDNLAIHAAPSRTCALLLGGGIPKHHILNANLMRNGCDWAVYINTAQEFDGCDSGARPDEAMSWGKIRLGGKAVKVYGDATALFPLLVAQSFAKVHFATTKNDGAGAGPS